MLRGSMVLFVGALAPRFKFDLLPTTTRDRARHPARRELPIWHPKIAVRHLGSAKIKYRHELLFVQERGAAGIRKNMN